MDLAVRALSEVVVDLERLPPARLPALALREVVAELAVEEVSPEVSVAEVSAVAAQVPPEAELPVLARPPLLAQLAALAQLEVVAELAVEEVSVEALHRSFSPAMVGNLPSTGTPRFSPVPRSGRKAKRHP